LFNKEKKVQVSDTTKLKNDMQLASKKMYLKNLK